MISVDSSSLKKFAGIFLCFWFLLSIPAYTQIPDVVAVPDTLADSTGLVIPDSLATQEKFILFDSLGYRFRGDGTFSRGNINRSLFILRTELLLHGPVVTLVSNPRYTYGEQKNVLAERELYVDLFIDIHEERKVYWFGLGIVEVSNLRAISLRQMAGAGIGWRLIKKSKQNSLSITNAIIYESTNFRTRPTISTTRNSLRLKGRHSFEKINLRFNHLTFVQPSINNFSSLRWNTLLSLEVPVSKKLSFRVSYENSYESIVEVGRRKHDKRLTFGFSFGTL